MKHKSENYKRYRDKLEKNQIDLNRRRLNNSISQKKYKNNIRDDPRKFEEYKNKNAQYMREYRKKVQLKESNKQQQSVEQIFKSSKAFKKAIERTTSALPKQKDKAQLVTKAIAKKFMVDVHPSLNPVPVPKIKRIRQNIQTTSKLIQEFISLDDISYQLPGKRDYKRVKVGSNEYEIRQKRQLLISLKEARRQFLELFPDHKIAQPTFNRQIEPHIIPFNKIKHNFCACIYCENIDLWIASLKPFMISISSRREFLNEFICSRENFDCATRNCEKCHDIQLKISQIFIADCEQEPINVLMWSKDENHGYFQKVRSQISSVKEAQSWILLNIEQFIMHKFLIQSQYETMKNIKINLSDTEIIFSMDFANNYECKSQNDIQAAYFSKKYLEIFTCVINIGQDTTLSYIVSCDTPNHSKEHIYYAIKLIIEDVKLKYPHITKIHFESDGPSSQFKNKYTLSNLLYMSEDFGLDAVHHFKASNHGKGSVDGLGGIVKRAIFKEVLAGRTEVYDASSFTECGRKIFSNVTFFHAKEENIDSVNQKILKPRWSKLLKNSAAPRAMHYFAPGENGKFLYSAITSSQHGLKKINIFK